MDKLLYGRCWEILVTEPSAKDLLERTTDRASEETNPRSSYRLPTLAITDLDFTLKTTMDGRSSSGGVNTAILSIHNLSDESVYFVSKNNNFVRIRAGYGELDDASILFTGMVTNSSTKNSNGTRITTLYLKEADSVVNAYRTSLSVIGSEKTYEDVFKTIVDAWSVNGVTSGDDTIFLSGSDVQAKLPKEVNLRGGWSGDGFLRDLTDSLCKEWGYTWFISKNILYMYPMRFSGFSRVLRFNLESNLIKDIELSQVRTTGVSSQKSDESIIVRTFLDGAMTTGSLLEIPTLRGRTVTEVVSNNTASGSVSRLDTKKGARDFSGTYVIKSLTYELDTLSKKWDSILVADKKVN